MASLRPRAVVLLSGGLDSATTLALALEGGFDVHALTVRYGQRHFAEIECAARIATELGVTAHRIVELDLSFVEGSALTDESVRVPKSRDEAEIGAGIPATYVPARNTIFLSIALAWAESLGANDLFIGVNALDYSGYPDCRPEYLEAFQRLARLATAVGVEGGKIRIRAPLIEMSKAEIVRCALDLGIDPSWTLSCYDPLDDGRPCGTCDACVLRAKGFREAGETDAG